jgi:hypothetical protein
MFRTRSNPANWHVTNHWIDIAASVLDPLLAMLGLRQLSPFAVIWASATALKVIEATFTA